MAGYGRPFLFVVRRILHGSIRVWEKCSFSFLFSPYCQKRGGKNFFRGICFPWPSVNDTWEQGGDAPAGCKDLLPQLYGEAFAASCQRVCPYFLWEESVHFESGEEGEVRTGGNIHEEGVV